MERTASIKNVAKKLSDWADEENMLYVDGDKLRERKETNRIFMLDADKQLEEPLHYTKIPLLQKNVCEQLVQSSD